MVDEEYMNPGRPTAPLAMSGGVSVAGELLGAAENERSLTECRSHWEGSEVARTVTLGRGPVTDRKAGLQATAR